MEPPQWPQRGWWEKRLWLWFDGREKILSDFVFPGGYAITAPWMKAFRNIAIAVAVAWGAGWMSPTAKFSVLGVGLFITISQVLVLFLNHGRAFQPLLLSGVKIPVYAGFAIGFCELSRLLFKCAIIQAPLLLAFTLTAGLAAAALAGFPLFAGIVFGLKCGLLLFASRFISVALTFSAGTNDTSSFKFRALLLIFLMVGFGLGFIGLGGVGLFLPNAPTAWMFCLGAAMDAYAFFWIYQWFYNSGRFDLMSLPRR